MKTLVALLMLFALGAPVSAAELRKGAVVQVKPNAIWFEEAKNLTRWQELKTSGDAAALGKYEDDMRAERDAWTFVNRLTVKVLAVDPARRQVHVEMMTRGRMHGTRWFLDTGTIVSRRGPAH